MTATVNRGTESDAEATGGKGKKGKKGKKGDKPKKSFFKSKKFLIILVLLIGVGGAYKFVLAPPAKPAPPSGGDMVVMDPNTVNLKGGHYLQVAISIQLLKGGPVALPDFQDSEAAELLIDQFSNRTVKELSVNKERTKLMRQLAARIKKAYPKEVFRVFLTKFVMQ